MSSEAGILLINVGTLHGQSRDIAMARAAAEAIFGRGWELAAPQPPANESNYGFELANWGTISATSALGAPFAQRVRWNWTCAYLPFWLLLLPLRALTLILWRLDRPRTVLPNHCPQCAYDLTGNTTGRCPACGGMVRVAPPPQPP